MLSLLLPGLLAFSQVAVVSPVQALTYLPALSSIKHSYPAKPKLTELKFTRMPVGTHIKQLPSPQRGCRSPLDISYPPLDHTPKVLEQNLSQLCTIFIVVVSLGKTLHPTCLLMVARGLGGICVWQPHF
ncbi:hypothetical protein CRENBAI_011079, partial [Crenichthys baileyi]